jgi:hypothetical protein
MDDNKRQPNWDVERQVHFVHSVNPFDEPPDSTDTPWRCPQCGIAILVARHCKSICSGCGYVESCEDPFIY